MSVASRPSKKSGGGSGGGGKKGFAAQALRGRMMEREQKQRDEERSAKAAVSSEPQLSGKKRKVSEVDDTDLAVAVRKGSYAHLVGDEEPLEEVELYNAPELKGMGEVARLELNKTPGNLAKLRAYFPTSGDYLSARWKRDCEEVVGETAEKLVAIARQDGALCPAYEDYIKSKGKHERSLIPTLQGTL